MVKSVLPVASSNYYIKCGLACGTIYNITKTKTNNNIKPHSSNKNNHDGDDDDDDDEYLKITCHQ